MVFVHCMARVTPTNQLLLLLQRLNQQQQQQKRIRTLKQLLDRHTDLQLQHRLYYRMIDVHVIWM